MQLLRDVMEAETEMRRLLAEKPDWKPRELQEQVCFNTGLRRGPASIAYERLLDKGVLVLDENFIVHDPDSQLPQTCWRCKESLGDGPWELLDDPPTRGIHFRCMTPRERQGGHLYGEHESLADALAAETQAATAPTEPGGADGSTPYDDDFDPGPCWRCGQPLANGLPWESFDSPINGAHLGCLTKTEQEGGFLDDEYRTLEEARQAEAEGKITLWPGVRKSQSHRIG
jgi:hypothetical protein